MTAIETTQASRTEVHNLLFGVRRSVLYHTKRRQFFDGLQNMTTTFSLLGASAAISKFASQTGSDTLTTMILAFVAVFNALSLVGKFSEKARTHYDLAKRFIALEQRIANDTEPSLEDFRQMVSQRLQIETDEPPKKYVLDTLCHNELCHAMGYTENTVYCHVSLIQRIFAHIKDVNTTSLFKK